MPSIQVTNSRIRGLIATAVVSWILLAISLFAPEWTREEDKHCGVIFCCFELYGNCTITGTAVVGAEFSYIFSSFLACFVAIFSSTCRCSDVRTENVRQTSILLVVAGVLALTGSTEFFIRKFTHDELDFAAGGFVAHIAGWVLFIAGCCGYCHGYDYHDVEFIGTSVYPFDMQGGAVGDIHRFMDPVSYAKRKWKERQLSRSTLNSVSEGVIA